LTNIKKINIKTKTQLTQLGLTPVDSTLTEKGKDAPNSQLLEFNYDPLLGGVSYNSINDKLTFQDRNETILCYIDNASSMWPIKQLLTPGMHDTLGIVLCAWTSITIRSY